MFDRSDPNAAQRAFELFAPSIAARRQLEELLADSVRTANSEGTSCWEITLRPRQLVFNVGHVALLAVRANHLDLYYRWTPAVRSSTTSSRAIGYSKRSIDAPIRALTLPLDQSIKLSSALREAHRSAIRAAAQAKSGTPWPYAHSPGVLALLRRGGRRAVPDPSYSRGAKPVAEMVAPLDVGAGFGSSAENVLVEKAAIDRAIGHYRDLGYKVQSVERDRRGYDLLCEKGKAKLFVEVKGIRGSHRSFLMTRGELMLGNKDSRFELALVTRALSAKAQLRTWSAREFRRDFDSVAIAFSVRFVGHAGGGAA